VPFQVAIGCAFYTIFTFSQQRGKATMNNSFGKLLLPAVISSLIPVSSTFAAAIQIEEVVVTATRRSENLQDVPIAISAFTENELAASGIESIEDLQTMTPGLTVSKQASAVNTFIRGIGAGDASAGQEAAVATYVDGIYIPSGYGALFAFSNIERIEVLKGPQGTLFGRNATGGLLNIVTKDPTDEPDFNVAVSYGNFETVEGKLYGSLGLSDNLAVNTALIFRNQGKGWGDGVDTGREVGFEGDYFGARGKVLYTPGEQTRITLGYEYFSTEDADTGLGRNLLPGTIATADGRSYNGDFYDSLGDQHPFWEQDAWGGSLTVEHQFDSFDFKSITAYREMENVQVFDNDLTPFVLFNVYIDHAIFETFTQEVQFASNNDSDLSWIVGAFYMEDDSGFEAPDGVGIIGAALGTGINIENRIKTESISAFGEVTYSFTDSTDLTMGLRWTQDDRELRGRLEVLSAIDFDAPIIPQFTAVVDPRPSFDEETPTWRIVLNHAFTEEFMGYVSYNRGFKSGNFITTDASAPPFESEEVDAYEIGFKSELADGRLQLNGAAFYYDYANLQVPNTEGGFLVTSNAAEAEIYGLDFEGQFLATENLRLRFGASFLDTEYTDYPNAPCVVFSGAGMIQELTCSATGNKLLRSPELEYNIAMYYSMPVSYGRYDLNVAYSYNDGYPFTPDNNTEQPSYDMVNAQVKWTTLEEHFSVGLFGKNLLDEETISYIQATFWGATAAPNPPRTYGIEFNYSY
jgi:iron complex outermembrane recepter protein